MGEHRIHKAALRTIVPLIALLAVGLLSGCMWGVVRDASTGTPLAGVNVTYTDVNGGSGTATTDANGIFAFDQATGPYPAMGPASFHLSVAGYEDLTAARLMEYNDSNATLSNLSSFWEVQSFNLVEHTVQMINFELEAIDVDAIQLAPPVPLVNVYAVGLKVYDPADMTTPLCEQVSPAQVYTSTNPAAVNLSLDCDIPGDSFAAKITVVAQQGWQTFVPIPLSHMNVDVSTIGYEWAAPSPNTSWETVTLGSSDATGPDDPDLSFQAQIRYRAKVESGP